MPSGARSLLVAHPIAIAHVELDSIAVSPLRELGERFLCVFWKDDMPLGQAYGTAPPGQAVDLSELAIAAGVGDRPMLETSAHSLPPASASVIICTRDRPAALERCLASFAEQTRRPEQILVIDNASTEDRTREVAHALGADYVREERPGLDIARNTGARHATGDIIAYTDDDVVLHHRWLERLVAAFDDEAIWAVTGLVLPLELETEAQIIFERHWGFGRGFARKDFGAAFYAQHRRRGCPAWEVGAGANMAFRRTVFEALGYFDERLDVGAAGCSGDSELWYRILHEGRTCRYEPSAVVFHQHRRSFDALARQIRAYMRGHAAALLVQHERSGERGNLKHLFWVLPGWYRDRLWARLRSPRATTEDCLLGAEILGCLEGVLYYLRAPRPRSAA